MSVMPISRRAVLAFLSVLLGLACSKKDERSVGSTEGGARPKTLKVGLVTDVGGRGDQSFNDSALRGLELWAAGKTFAGGRYREATPDEIRSSLSPDVAQLQPPIHPLPVAPLILQSKAQEDYEPNLQLLVDQSAALAIGTGFMLENAVETVAKRNPGAKFLLIDSPLLDAQGMP